MTVRLRVASALALPLPVVIALLCALGLAGAPALAWGESAQARSGPVEAKPHAAQTKPRAVIELFTSQGCSACPSADRLITQYASDPSVIALTLAVDYWDYLGWKDTLALNGHSKRQRAYAKSRGDRQVYTPQAVIDGAVHALGSDKAAIERAIAQTRAERAPLRLAVTMTQADGTLAVNVPASPAGTAEAAEVWLCPFSKSIEVAIERGENSGNTFVYTNVVRRWIKLGNWTGKAETFRVPVSDFQDGKVDGVAVMVQNWAAGAPRLILGASQTALR